MITNVLKLVFSSYRYLFLSCVIFTGMLLSLLFTSQYIFLSPYVTGHVPYGSETGFFLILIISTLSGIVIPMNIYRVSLLKNSKTKVGGGVLGSIIGASAGACSCGPLGFAVISTFGTIGGVASSFLTNYETPIRIVATLILSLTFYTTIKSIKTECKLIKH